MPHPHGIYSVAGGTDVELSDHIYKCKIPTMTSIVRRASLSRKKTIDTFDLVSEVRDVVNPQ